MPVFGPGQATRVYAMAERPGVDFSAGVVSNTGRELDVAVHGEGWIAVQGRDGREAYTRAGDLRVTPNGQLTTGAGLPVLGNGGPIAIPQYEKLDIGADGTITIRPSGQAASALAVVDRIKLVSPPLEQLSKGEDGLMRLRDGREADPDARVQLVSGSLEGSNVNAVDALVNMLTLQRQFEMQVKMMRTTEETDAAASQVMRLV
jgi:flagellar basal-body rod protein FlgF